MTVAKLKDFFYIKKRIEHLDDEIRCLRESAEPRSPDMSGNPRAPSGANRLDELIPEIVDKEREKESDEHYGNMGIDMGLEMTLTEKELATLTELCKHMVGLDRHKPYHRHGKAYYKPYRNYFCEGLCGNELFDKLTGSLGLMIKRCSENCTYYYLTRAGLDWLGRRLKIKIGDERR